MKKKTSAHRSDLVLLTPVEVKGLLDGNILDLSGTLIACDLHWGLTDGDYTFKEKK